LATVGIVNSNIQAQHAQKRRKTGKCKETMIYKNALQAESLAVLAVEKGGVPHKLAARAVIAKLKRGARY